jgi:hypothetical protein
MKTKLLLLVGLSLLRRRADCNGQTPRLPAQRGSWSSAGIVQAEAQKLSTKAVEFGMWVDDSVILTTALGNSMTTVPATTDMHYRSFR